MMRLAPMTIAAAMILAAAPDARAWNIVNLAVGAKGMVGGNLWTQPENIPPSEIGFTDARGGYGGGGGVFAEVRVIKYIALEVDLLWERNNIWENQSWHVGPFTFQTTTHARATTMRIPILVKGILPLGGVRLGLGLGPEFVVPLSTSADVDYKQANMVQDPNLFHVTADWATMLTVDLDITICLWKGLHLPIDLRASYNLTQSKDWNDRVSWTRNGQPIPENQVKPGDMPDGFQVNYQNSWDFRLLLGLGYEF